MKFVVTPAPARTESLMGYLLRLSESNGYPSTSYPLSTMQSTWFRSSVGRLDARPLIELAGVSPEAIERLTHRPKLESKAFVSVYGNDLPSYEVRLREPKICPLCIGEGSGCEAFWDLSQAIACPVHQVRLVARCWKCEQKISWSRAKVANCRCGAPLSQSPVERVSDELNDLMALLRHKVYGDNNLAPLPRSMEHMAHLTSRSLCKLMWVMSGTLNALQGAQSMPKSRTRYIPQITELAGIFSNWPTGFRGFLSAYCEPIVAKEGRLPSFNKFFSWLLTRLIKNDGDGGQCYEFLQEEIIRFGSRHWSRGMMSRIEGRIGSDVRFRWGTISEGAEVLGLHMATMKKRIDAGEIKVRVVGSNKIRNLLVDLDWARQQKHSQLPPINIRSAARELGVSIETFKAMCFGGHFEVNHQPRFPGSLAREDFNAIASRLRALGEMEFSAPVKTSVSIADLFLKYPRSGGEKAKFIAEILMRPDVVVGCAKGPFKVSNLLVDTIEAEEILESTAYSGQAGPPFRRMPGHRSGSCRAGE